MLFGKKARVPAFQKSKQESITIYRLIAWCLTPFPTVFQLYHGSKYTFSCFPGVLLTSTPHNILSKHWLLSHITTVETTDSDERGINPVAKTIIYPRKEYWPSRELNR